MLHIPGVLFAGLVLGLVHKFRQSAVDTVNMGGKS